MIFLILKSVTHLTLDLKNTDFESTYRDIEKQQVNFRKRIMFSDPEHLWNCYEAIANEGKGIKAFSDKIYSVNLLRIKQKRL